MDLASSQTAASVDRGDRYDEFLTHLEKRAVKCAGPLFTTSASGLPEVFLDHIDPESRQLYTCGACARFLEAYGGLVTVDEDGRTRALFWEGEVPPFYRRAVDALRERVTSAVVTGVFVSSRAMWGRPETGPWRHMAVGGVPEPLVYRKRVLTASQVAAERRADFETLERGLAEFPHAAVEQALSLLRRETLYRSERVLGVAQWLDALHAAVARARGRERAHVVWRAVATAPPGFCHVKSTMVGTLLEDIVAGMPFEQVSRRFAEKMHPLQYQRPTAAPSAGNLARAEKIVAELKSAGSLERRFARLSDLQPLWLPRPEAEVDRPSRGVFDHLKALAGKVDPVQAPAVTMTWEKFQRTVLPEARCIELYTPDTNASYSGLVTAADPAAPNIMQWDNPVTCYMYVNGSRPSAWNLAADSWHELTAITLSPWMWGAPPGHHAHQGKQVFFIAKGARDTSYRGGAGFFPSFLKSEYHEIRATLEAYAKAARIQGEAEAEACGLCLGAGGKWSTRLRVNRTDLYALDRWD